ncbi:MAG: hypothetical protein K2P30_09705 [Lachnospiraceae bacterium]|nr:hypothetical protein [Lachnospiraceae bacterium]
MIHILLGAADEQRCGRGVSLRSPYKNASTWRGFELLCSSRAWYCCVFIERERGDEGYAPPVPRPSCHHPQKY